MKKLILLVVITLSLFGCQKKVVKVDISKTLIGNTFDMSVIGEKDTITIEFKDSTYTVFEYNEYDMPWRMTSFENNDILVLHNFIIPVKQIDENNLKGIFIKSKNHEVHFDKRDIPWNKELLYGIWIEESKIGVYSNDNGFPPPPPPALSLKDTIFNPTPFYEITRDSIIYKGYFETHKSRIEINSSNEFIIMELGSKYYRVEKKWKIKTLNDSVLIINRTVDRFGAKFSSMTKTEENIKLVKKVK